MTDLPASGLIDQFTVEPCGFADARPPPENQAFDAERWPLFSIERPYIKERFIIQ
jgi:hypothetical protein